MMRIECLIAIVSLSACGGNKYGLIYPDSNDGEMVTDVGNLDTAGDSLLDSNETTSSDVVSIDGSVLDGADATVVNDGSTVDSAVLDVADAIVATVTPAACPSNLVGFSAETAITGAASGDGSSSIGIDSEGRILVHRPNATPDYVRYNINDGTTEHLPGLDNPATGFTFVPTGVLPDGRILGLETSSDAASAPTPVLVTVVSGTTPSYTVDGSDYVNIVKLIPTTAGTTLVSVIQSGDGTLVGMNVTAPIDGGTGFTLYEVRRTNTSQPFPGTLQATTTIPSSTIFQKFTGYDYDGLYAFVGTGSYYRSILVSRPSNTSSFDLINDPNSGLYGLSKTLLASTNDAGTTTGAPGYAWNLTFSPDCSFAVGVGSPGGASGQGIYSFPQANPVVGQSPTCNIASPAGFTSGGLCLTDSATNFTGTVISQCETASTCTLLSNTHATIECEDDTNCEAGSFCYLTQTNSANVASGQVTCLQLPILNLFGKFTAYRVCRSPANANVSTCTGTLTCKTPTSSTGVQLLPSTWGVCQ
jgi:hypothetical protein